MIKIISLFFSIFFLSSSCSKKCKECYLIENIGLATEHTINLGEKCGDELDQIDDKQYVSNSGSARSYCE